MDGTINENGKSLNYIQNANKGNTSMWRYIVFLGIFFGFSLLSLGEDSHTTQEKMSALIQQLGELFVFVVVLLPFVILMIFLWIWVKFGHGLSFKDFTTARPRIDFRRFFFSFSWCSVIIVGLILCQYVFSSESLVWNFKADKFLYLLLISAILIPIQAGFEEYLFRGYVMQAIGLKTQKLWIPLLVSSVIFGLMHIVNPEVGKLGYGIMVYYIGTGLFLGIMTLMDDGLELALGYHIANNFMTGLLVTSDWSVLQTPSLFKEIGEKPSLLVSVFIPVLVVYPVLLFIFARKYRWVSWQKKLNISI